MRTNIPVSGVAIIAIASLVASCQPAAEPKAQAEPVVAAVPSVEGTDVLVSRTLPDGSKHAPPEVTGLQTFTKDRRNFNVMALDSAGAVAFSYSVVSTYKLTDKEYTETMDFGVMNDLVGVAGGHGLTNDLSHASKTVPVKVEGGRIEYHMPFDL